MPRFAIVTLTALALIAIAAPLGGGWPWAALAYLTLMAGLADHFARTAPEAPPEISQTLERRANALSALLAVLHVPLILLVLAALEAGHGLGNVALFAAAGIYIGQVGNSNAHELIHRSARWLRRLGDLVLISHLFGHHRSAHLLVHHPHVATPRDPNSARKGRGYYRFARDAWAGSFREGARAETARMRRAGRPLWRHPYVGYLAGAAAMLALVALLFGLSGLLRYLGLAGFATGQLLMSDYVQHYGLRRRIGADGKPEPVGPAHSWNSAHWFSTALMLNAPLHSDHHAHPTRAYPALRLPEAAPILPYPLPVMAAIALIPPLWRRTMDKRLAA